jgi:hypothetical protein
LRHRIALFASVLAVGVKRALVLVLAALGLALGALAAPALSVRPYSPEPVEFELSAPAEALSSSAPGRHVVSRPLRAPKRFNLVGMRWRGGAEPAIAVRSRRAGGRWSPWVPVAAHPEHAPDAGAGEGRARIGTSDPVWVGEADELQYRMDRVPAGLRLHFVNVEGTATAAERARTALRRSAHAAVSLLARPLGDARAQGGPPPMAMRSEWDPENRCAPRSEARYGTVGAVLVHHTVSTNDYAPEQAAGRVLATCLYHRNSNGWDDVGYNFLVDKYGRLYEGRAGGIDQAVVGAHAQGFNSETTSVSNLGTHTDVPQTAQALDAMAALIRWKLAVHGQPTSGTVELTSGGGDLNRYPAGQRVAFERVSGHRDAGRTACPGEALYAQLPELRQRVGGGGGEVVRPARTRLLFGVAPRTLSYAAGTRVSGSLRRLTGEPVAGAPVEVQLFVGRRWVTIDQLGTRDDGTFEGPVSPAVNGLLRVRYPGGYALRPTVSSGTTVRVRPTVEVRRSIGRAEVGRTPIVEGTIAPQKSRVTVVVQRRAGRRNVTVARYRVGVRSGRFRKGHRLRETGLYRFYAVSGSDSRNLAASSNAVYVRAVPASGGAPPG